MDYWQQEAGQPRGDEGQDPAWEEFKSFVLTLPEEEAKDLIVRVVQDDKPTYLSLAEIYAQRGNSEDANRSVDRAYQAVLAEFPDPTDQRSLGYLALRRHGGDLPLSESDFEGHFTLFGNGEQLLIVSCSYEPRLPDFPDSDQMITLAIRAYGLAWLYYFRGGHREHTVTDAWRELLALEGLRAAFIRGGDLVAVAVACRHFDGWLNEWEKKFDGTGFIEPFIANFAETRGYLRGRQDSGQPNMDLSVAGRELVATRRLLAWQLSEILSEVRGKDLSAERLDDLAESVANKVAKQLNNAPAYIVESFEKQLEQEFGNHWPRLSPEVRRLLVQAEYLRSVLHQSVDTDWAPVALHYVRAVETQLRLIGESLDVRRLNETLNSGFPFRRAIIEKFRNVFQRSDFVEVASKAGLPGAKSLAEMGPRLDHLLKNYRNPAVHDAEPFSPVKAMEMRKLILAVDDPQKGILWQLNHIGAAAH